MIGSSLVTLPRQPLQHFVIWPSDDESSSDLVPLIQSGDTHGHELHEAAKTYANNPVALHLRAMNMLYEGLKRSNSTIVIVPSTAVETMQLGGAPTMATVASAIAHAKAAGESAGATPSSE